MGNRLEKGAVSKQPDAPVGTIPRDLRKQMMRLALTGSDVRTVADMRRVCGQDVRPLSQSASNA